MCEKKPKEVFLILNRDPSQVQGNTEKHYLAKFLAQKSNLHVFAPFEEPVEDAINHNLRISGITGVLLINILFTPYWLYHFYREKPDVVYCYESIILPAFLGRWIFGATVAFDLRSDPYDQAWEFLSDDDRGAIFRVLLWIGKYLHYAALQWADYVFVVSEPLADTVCSNYRLDRTTVRLLPLGVDTNKFKQSNKSFDQISVVYVGAINGRRGFKTVIEAIGGLPAEMQENLRLDLYGGGPDGFVTDFVSQASETLSSNVNWHGRIPHEDIPEQAAKSDIAVSPLPPYEAYQVSSPAKIFEYLAMGLPIIASRISPHERILEDEKNALLYEPGSADCLRKQLKLLINDDDKRKEFGRNARSTALEYSWNQRFSIVETSLSLTEE